MSEAAAGPLWRLDGPPPIAPRYGLLQAAASGAPEVRLNPPENLLDTVPASGAQVERYLNGVELYPFIGTLPTVWDACAVGSMAVEKPLGDDVPHPRYAAMTIVEPISCTSYRIGDQDAFKARAVRVLGAVEGAAVEREFMTGDVMGLNPHLTDGNAVLPYGAVATTASNGLAMIENYIAEISGRAGIIHCTPGMLTAFASHFLLDNDEGVIRTLNGTLVIPGYGYAGAESNPLGQGPVPSVLYEWIYATGPIDVRRTEIFTTPDTVAEALDRGTGGATLGDPNMVTYRAERYYLVDWDTEVQAAVLVNRCAIPPDGCGSPPA